MKIATSPKGKTCKPQRISHSAVLTLTQLQHAYDELAERYEKKAWFDQHILGVARLRKKLLSKASGYILEVACGAGANFAIFPAGGNITAVDLSPNMLKVAHENAHKHNLHVNLAVMDAERLEFPDESFDTVVSTLSTCTFPNPTQALREMKRVCRPNGLILLLEHGHSSMPWLARYQDRHEYQHYEDHAGCRWNQNPLELIEAAGITIVNSQRNILGMFHSIEAKP